MDIEKSFNPSISPSCPSILTIPPELLQQILQQIPPPDLSNVSLTCKKLNEAANDDSLWRIIIRNEFGIKLDTESHHSNRSAKIFYYRILRKYGKAIGLWNQQNLHQVLYDEDWGLLMLEWLLEDASAPMIARKVIAIKINWDTYKTEILVYKNHDLYSHISVSLLSGDEWLRIHQWDFDIPEEYADEEVYRNAACDLMKRFAEQETRDLEKEQDEILRRFKVLIQKKIWAKHFSRLIIARSPEASDHPIQAGLFKRKRRGIWNESKIINLSYQHYPERGAQFRGNAFAGELVFQGSLQNAFGSLSRQQQEDWTTLKSLNPSDFIGVSAVSPLYPPSGCQRFKELTKCSLARFACRNDEGEISGHFVVFSEDLFGVVFVERRELHYFHRVKENVHARSLGEAGIDVLYE